MTSYLQHYFRVLIYDKKAAPQHGSKDQIWDLVSGRFPYATGCSIKIEAEKGDFGVISVTLDAPFEEGKDMLSSSMFATGNLIQIKMGWVDGDSEERETPWYYGFLNQGGVGLQLTSNGLSGTLSAERKGKGQYYDEVNSHKSYLESIRARAAKSNVELLLDAAQSGADQILQGAAKLLRMSGVLGAKEMIDRIQTDLNIRFSEFDQLNTVQFKVPVQRAISIPAAMKVPPVYNFVMRGSFDRAKNIYPIESLSTNPEAGNFTFAPKKEGQGAKSAGIGKDGAIFSVVKTPGTSEQPQGNTKRDGASQGHKAKLPGGTEDSLQEVPDGDALLAWYADRAVGDMDVESVGLVAQSLVDYAHLLDGMKADVTVLGLPQIIPHEMCTLSNTGALIDGSYLIKIVEHSASVNSFMTKLSLVSQSVPSTGGQSQP